jgi:hypothetical protein
VISEAKDRIRLTFLQQGLAAHCLDPRSLFGAEFQLHPEQRPEKETSDFCNDVFDIFKDVFNDVFDIYNEVFYILMPCISGIE